MFTAVSPASEQCQAFQNFINIFKRNKDFYTVRAKQVIPIFIINKEGYVVI